MSGTTVPAALAALGSLIASALPTWAVVDGPVWDIPTNVDFACVGFTGNTDEAGVDVTSASADAAMAGYRETFSVFCLLTAHVGTNDLPTLRNTAYAALSAIQDALEADRALGTTVLIAEIVSHSLIQGVGETGTAVTVPFTVQIQSWSA